MRDIIIGIACTCAGAILIYIGGWIRKFLAKRLKVEGPLEVQMKKQGAILEKVVPALNAVVEVQRPQLDLLIALGEAAQGNCNGNIEKALLKANAGRDSFASFLDGTAKIEEPKSA